ncbi:MAG TPA: hypothetical protein VNV43_00245 [Candidatus Acidoferrales bacterium]|jgi:hypothetical protein|nr:hypothetical protein [Candidatus Acidoferrales bacterium]
MKIGEFILTTLAVALGATIALAVAGLYAKQQLSAATATNSTLGNVLAAVGL